jgi:hypothetical protein
MDLDGDGYGESLLIGFSDGTYILIVAFFDNTSSDPANPGGPGWGYVEHMYFQDVDVDLTHNEQPAPAYDYVQVSNPTNSSSVPNTPTVSQGNQNFLADLNSQMSSAYSTAKEYGVSAAPAASGHLGNPMTNSNWEESSSNLSEGYSKDFDPFPVSNR